MRRTLLTTAALAFALPLTLAACGHGAPTRFLTLDATAPGGMRADYAGPPVAVEALHLPPLLDRQEVAQETAANTVRVDDLARWSAPPGVLALDALASDLASRLPAGAVVYPRTPVPAGALRLVVDVIAVDDTGGRASLDAGWTLLGPSRDGPAAVLARRSERVTAPSAGQGSQAVAADLTALLGRLSERIAASLPPAAP